MTGDNLDPLRRDVKELSTRVEQVHGDVRRLSELFETNIVFVQENIKRIEDKEIGSVRELMRERILDIKQEMAIMRARHDKDIEELRRKLMETAIKAAATTGILSVIVSIIFIIVKGGIQ